MANHWRLLSVGHSNHSLAEFLVLLRGAGVTALADVRTQPASRYAPHTNAGPLATALRDIGITYVFLGDALGGRPSHHDVYDEEGRVDYERVRQTDWFVEGLDRLVKGTERYVVAMMCGEEDPLDCHRGLMITPSLTERGIHPGHLRRDGRIETTPEMEQRLLAITGVGDGLLDGLFADQLDEQDRKDLLVTAYRKRSKRVAYRLDQQEGEGSE